MDGTGRAAVGLAVALRDAHFRLKCLARAWEDGAPKGAVRGRAALGPTWQYTDDPDRATYTDGQAIELADGLTVVLELSVRFSAAGTDLLAGAYVEGDDGNAAELLSTGPEEFPPSADALVAEIGRCLDRMEHLDPAGVLC
ncbi:hypothetical protein GCM10010441_04320 [Kitasatospora paracochleata]|uniref:Immunity protein Imm1 n=1 Tax=Kitasatospora paracochleata TaxID=58354 RepID=A0ABT1J8J1_9ACTN|nr:hypothetical protein [Kitasatospora paracochleata]MCP2313762.1 hypothetical protein [Kitasatospora paracochleata]